MKNEKYGKQLVETITEKVTLNLFKVGCDKKNFEILKLLPSNLKELQEKFDLSKMPMNRRINELEEAGLIKRDRYTGKVNQTRLTEVFIKMIEELKEIVIKEIPDLL